MASKQLIGEVSAWKGGFTSYTCREVIHPQDQIIHTIALCSTTDLHLHLADLWSTTVLHLHLVDLCSIPPTYTYT